MENQLLHAAATALAHRLNRYTRKDGLEFKKLIYGMEILLINVSKLIIIYLLAAALGVVVPTLITHGAYVAVKRYSFGLHALNSTVCTIVSCCLFVFIPWLLQGVGVGNGVVAAAFVLVIFCLWRYAPADTKARPLVGPKLRARIKRKAIASGAILMAIALMVPSQQFKLLILVGAVFQAVSILPCTYKILKRSGKNYEAYESA